MAAQINNNVSISAMTDVGQVRNHNEDNFIVCPDLGVNEWYLNEKPFALSSSGCLLVVADGMGGANAGEVASQIAVESVKKFFLKNFSKNFQNEKQEKSFLREAILDAHENIVKYSTNNPACEGMGTTIVIAWILPWKAIIAWCGDSRGYLYRINKGITIITKDHSLVWELVEAGKLTPQEADVHPNSNIITQSLGDSQNPPEPDIIIQPLQPLDKLLFCSDGLNNMVDLDDIGNILGQEKSLLELNQILIETANQNGGKDNITVVSLEVLAEAQSPDFYLNENNKDVYKKPFVFILIFLSIMSILVVLFTSSLSNKQPSTKNISKVDNKEEVVLVKPVFSEPKIVQREDEINIKENKKIKSSHSVNANNTKNLKLNKKKTSPIVKDPTVDLNNPEEKKLTEKIEKIKWIIQERSVLILPKTNSEVTNKSLEEAKFYEDARNALIENLDQIINDNEWTKLLAEFETSSSKIMQGNILRNKYPDLAKLDAELDKAMEVIAKLKQE